MIGILAFAWINACTALTAIRLVQRLLPGENRTSAAVAGLVAFVALTHAGLMVCSSISLSPLALAVWCPLLLALSHYLPGTGSRNRARLETNSDSGGGRWQRPAAVLATVVLVSVLGRWLWATLVDGAMFDWDDFAYHAANPAWWLRHGILEHPPLTYQVYFPFNSELLPFWFMVPLHGDAHANLSIFIWLMLLVTASLAIARHLEHGAIVPPLVLVCFLISPKVLFFLDTFSGPDLAVAGLCLAALALAWPPPGRSNREFLVRAAWCGVAAGLAIGAKAPALSTVGLLGLWWGGVALRRRQWGLVVAFSVSVLAFGSFWYVRNWLATGNPLFPAEVGPFAGPFTRAAQAKTALWPHIAEGWRAPRFWLSYWERRMDWPLPLGLLAGLGYLSALFATLLPGQSRGQSRYRLLLACAGLLFLFLYPLQPFSGTNNRPTSGLNHQVRYITYAFALGLTLLPAIGMRRPRVQAGLAVLSVAAATWALVIGAEEPFSDLLGDLGPVAAGLAVAVVALLCMRTWPNVAADRRTIPTMAILLILLQASWTHWKAESVTYNLYHRGGNRPVGKAWQALEHLPNDTRVAVFSNLNSSLRHFYPLFGRRFQLEPVSIYQDGRARDSLHLTWKDEPGPWWWEFYHRNRVPPGEELLHNLQRAGVEVLLVTKWAHGKRGEPGLWPRQHLVLAGVLPARRRLYEDGYSVIWDLRGI